MVEKNHRKHNGKGGQRVNESVLLKLNPLPAFMIRPWPTSITIMDSLGVFPYGMSVCRLNSRYMVSYSAAAASQHSVGCPTSCFG